MSDVKQILAVLPYHRKDVVVVPDKDQDTGKIIDYLEICHKNQRGDYDRFSRRFWKGSAKETAKSLFDFCKQNITYKIEPEAFQSVQTPASILHRGYGDCKHYALFINGVADSLNRQGFPIRGKFRLVSDSPDRDVHHVFAVISDPNSTNIFGMGDYWVDPVLNGFNSRPSFYNTKDMAIHYLSGTTKYDVQQVGAYDENEIGAYYDAEMGNIFKKFAHSMEVNFKNVKKGYVNSAKTIAKDIKKAGQAVAKGAKAVKTAVVKVAGLPVRKAFLSLVALNIHGFATDLAKARKDPNKLAKLKKKWTKDLEGDWKVLDQAISNGMNRRRIGYCIGVLGVDDAAIATWLTLAATAIGIFSEFLGTKDKPQEKQKLTAGAQQGAANILANAYNASTGGRAAAAAMNNLVKPGKGSGAMAITPSVNSQGEPEVYVHDIDSPAVRALAAPNNEDGLPDESYYADGVNGEQKGERMPDKPRRNAADTFFKEVERIWTNYKTPIMVIGGAGLVIGIATSSRRRRRR